jgi:hypothetical protein
MSVFTSFNRLGKGYFEDSRPILILDLEGVHQSLAQRRSSQKVACDGLSRAEPDLLP